MKEGGPKARPSRYQRHPDKRSYSGWPLQSGPYNAGCLVLMIG